MTKSKMERGVTRVLAKLDKSIEEGNFYEAHQMYRTLYFRYTAQRKYDDCLELLSSGAQQLIAKDQETSAADLGLLMLETLEKREGDNTSSEKVFIMKWMGRLGSIIAQLNPSVVERETLINRALKWSGDVSGNSLGHPEMHKLVAQVFWNENNIEQARHHYLLCRDGQLCGRVLIKISTTKGYKNEKDLFIVQAVLQQLCLKESKTAEDTFKTYTANHPQIKQEKAPFYLPLLNFLHFLFCSIHEGRLDSFRVLCNLYKPSLNRDPAFEKYLTKIAMIYFGAAPRQSSGLFGGMFGDLFSRFFQDFDGEDEEDNDQQGGGDRAGARGLIFDRLQQELD